VRLVWCGISSVALCVGDEGASESEGVCVAQEETPWPNGFLIDHWMIVYFPNAARRPIKSTGDEDAGTQSPHAPGAGDAVDEPADFSRM
jgi:hypothetical protein